MTGAPAQKPITGPGNETVKLAQLRDIAGTLLLEGKAKDSLVLLEHLETVTPDDPELLRLLVRSLSAEGQILNALEKLIALRDVATDAEPVLEEIRALMPSAIEKFNQHVASGEVVEAEAYAAALVTLIPRNPALLRSALSCNMALGRDGEIARYAQAILNVDPSNTDAKDALSRVDDAVADALDDTSARMAAVLSGGNGVHPLLRLRDIHDLISAILCAELTERSIGQIGTLLKAARETIVDVPSGSEWEGWAKHYRLAVEACDPKSALAATPVPVEEPIVRLATSSGVPLDWPQVQTRARNIGAQAVFFAAADVSYINLYAKWYVSSILEHCDVPCLIVLHVIGGAGNLRDIANSVGIDDDRLIFAGDEFDAACVGTRCYDTPPKGLIARPVAHFQSVRFLKLGLVLRTLGLPVIVSDIDILLQRGISDLLDRCAGADIVLNENTLSASAGSRYTANLLLVNPTDNANVFLRFLQNYLERALSGSEVSRWIDQFALMQARHHLARRGNDARIEYFDTGTDINNVMYKSYQDHPFRFLSLYHGFDMSSLSGTKNRRSAA